MSGLYAPDGGWNVTLVGQNDLPIGVYAADGSIRVTTDSGQGLYAPNGSIRISDITVPGIYNPSGGLQGVLSGSEFYPAWMNPPADSGSFLLMMTGDYVLQVDSVSKINLMSS